jgi:two-component system response regulator YesN
MYKVLIADDESIIRNAIVNTFNWQEYGMEVVGTCKNGLEAISLVQTLRPDICLLDIQMPLVNGLELIEKINTIDKSILKIIISGHDEFEFARKAVELGVYKYILKPIDENEFIMLLKEIKQEMDEAKRAALANRRKEKILQVSRNLLRGGLLGEWITGGLKLDAEDETEEYFKELGLQLFNTTGLLWVSVSFPVSILENERMKEEQMVYCRKRLEEHFVSEASFCFVQLFSDSFILLYNAADGERWNNIQQELTPPRG